MNIVQIDNTERHKFLDLLLIADEQERLINKYLYRGKMFSLYDNGLKVVCIVTKEDNRIFEIKNRRPMQN